MRFLVPALLALLVAASASAKSAPTYSVTFAGTGSEHQLDQQQAFDAAWSKGQAMSHERAASYALEDLPPEEQSLAGLSTDTSRP